MKVIVKGKPKEITAFVVGLQGRRDRSSEKMLLPFTSPAESSRPHKKCEEDVQEFPNQ